MVNTVKLKKIIAESGLKLSKIAEEMDISTQTLYSKINNQTEFKAGEVKRLCLLLGIESLDEREGIFFAN